MLRNPPGSASVSVQRLMGGVMPIPAIARKWGERETKMRVREIVLSRSFRGSSRLGMGNGARMAGANEGASTCVCKDRKMSRRVQMKSRYGGGGYNGRGAEKNVRV